MVRMTNQRKVILEELRKHVDHPTADQIYAEIRKVLPKVSLGTVYRNLDQMSNHGTILKLEGAGQKRFDPVPVPHPHFRCVDCGSVEDIPIEIHAPSIDNDSKFYKERNLQGYILEFFGQCKSCK
jgi:Fur family transcriptional regulator, ferric uptake regulator